MNKIGVVVSENFDRGKRERRDLSCVWDRTALDKWLMIKGDLEVALTSFFSVLVAQADIDRRMEKLMDIHQSQ